MPVNYKHYGDRLQVTAAGARTSGNITADILDAGGTCAAGVCQASAVTGEKYWVAVRGVFNLPVPAATAAGIKLYVPGVTPTAGNGLVLTATSTSNSLFCKTLKVADASNKADCLLLDITY
jgi:predicted RecA/RadA family phage recombinase